MVNNENLGPAERIIDSLLAYTDHMVHNRPGVIVPDARTKIGVRWEHVTHKVEGDEKVVYRLVKGAKRFANKVGVMQPNGQIKDATGKVVGEYRQAGIFPEVAVWMYRQVAEVWKLDNEFAARWASFAFSEENRDLKVVLAAFMLVQARKGDPVIDGGKVAFYDEDFRDVGEAMVLLHQDKLVAAPAAPVPAPVDVKGKKVKGVKKEHDKTSLSAKMLVRIYDLLSLPQIAAINRELGFGKSARKQFLGRWTKAVHKWLLYREQNPKLLQGLVKAGFRTTVMNLARMSAYKPESGKFFEALRWKQAQADQGHRTLVIGKEVAAAETWEGKTEEEVCVQITKTKPNLKRIVGLLPKGMGLTRAIMAAAIESGSLSDKDLIISTPTLEELGLLQVQDVRERWERAIKAADDMRAANIATRVKSQETKEKLQEGADVAVQKAVAEVVRNVRIYFMVDISGSMQGAIQAAKGQIARFLQGFPPENVHVAVFNTAGRVIRIQHASAAGVENAFRGILAGGGTDYGAGVRVLQEYKTTAEEDALFIFVGDEEAGTFDRAVRESGLNPTAFGFLKVGGAGHGTAVRLTATALGIPCFMIDENTFADPYAIPRTIRALVAATPVGQRDVPRAAPRVTLVTRILKTDLLRKPAWAA